MKVLKFGAVWCQGCLVMKPRWQKIEEENPWLETEYFDFDQDQETVEKYGVSDGRLPTFIFLDSNNNELFRKYGEMPEKKLLELINANKDK